MRTLRFSLCGFPASVTLPDHFFDDRGRPLWHLLNARFGSPVIVWQQVIGAVPVDEEIVFQPTQSTPIADELRMLRDVVASLEKKADGVI